MSLQGILRELAAAQCRAERDERRRQRLLDRQLKLRARYNELQRSAAEAEEYEERLQQLTTIHRSVGEAMNWAEIRRRAPLPEPQKLLQWETAAVQKRDTFKPTFWQKLAGKESELRAKLEQEIVEAKKRDETSYQAALKIHQQQLEHWRELNRLATAILQGDTAIYRYAIEELKPFSEILEIGCELEISFPDSQTAIVAVTVESAKVVPRESKTLTRTGKLSVKPISEGKACELYQDYVCGCALRTARELFSFLPLSRVVVDVSASLLDSSTGLLRKETILSVGLPRETVDGMNFIAVGASNAMALFIHRMGFKRSHGFFPIEPLSPSEYPRVEQRTV